MILIGAGLHWQRGVPARIPDRILAARHGGTDPWLLVRQDDLHCYDRKAGDACRFGNAAAKERWVLLGDSHLAAFAQPLLERVERRNGQLLMLTRGACPYAPSLEMRIDGNPDVCTYEEGVQRRQIMLSEPSGIVVLGGRMPMYLSGRGFDNGEGGVEHAPPYRLHEGPKSGNQPETADEIAQSVAGSFKELLAAGHRLVLVYPVPEIGVNVPSAVFHGKPHGRKEPLSIPYQQFVERTRSTYALYDSLGNDDRIVRVKPERLFCNTVLPQRCVAEDGERVFYSDDDHLAVAGSTLLADEIIRAVDSRWGKAAARF
jgi:SGNH domain (fused to AT3 domains)